jgi:hypothetical protein
MSIKTKNLIINTVSDLVSDFFYYDRKEDEDLGRGEIEQAIKDGVLTVDDIVEKFKESLIERLD